MADVIRVGEKAPDFVLKDHNEREIRLSDLKGKKVLLSFHPLAWTKVCAEQMKSLEAHVAQLEKLNTVALGMSVDTVPSKKAWAHELGIEKTSLLSDFWLHGEVAKSYGIFREKSGTSERANIIIDEEGRVMLVKVYPVSQLPDIDEILKVLESKK